MVWSGNILRRIKGSIKSLGFFFFLFSFSFFFSWSFVFIKILKKKKLQEREMGCRKYRKAWVFFLHFPISITWSFVNSKNKNKNCKEINREVRGKWVCLILETFTWDFSFFLDLLNLWFFFFFLIYILEGGSVDFSSLMGLFNLWDLFSFSSQRGESDK